MKKTAKKLLCTIMALLLCLSCKPLVSLASGTESVDFTVDISAQREIMKSLDNLEFKVVGININPDLSALWDYLDVTVECVDAKGKSYTQTIDISEQTENLVDISFSTTAPAKKITIKFNSISKMTASLLGSKIKLVDSAWVPGFAVNSAEFGERLFEAHEATVLEDFTVNLPVKIAGMNVSSETKFSSSQYSFELSEENITVDVSEQLALMDVINGVKPDVQMLTNPDFTELYNYLDVDVVVTDTDGNIYTKTIDISEVTESTVDLRFSVTAPIEKAALCFNSLEEIIAKVLSINISLLKTDFIPGFRVYSSTFGEKLFTADEVQVIENFEGSFTLPTDSLNLSAIAKMQKVQYVLDVYNEDITVNIAAPREFISEFEDIKVNAGNGMTMKLDMSEIYDYLDVTVVCTDTQGNTYEQIIDVSEAESNLVDLSFATAAPIRKIAIRFYGIEQITAKMFTSNITILDSDYLQEFVITSSRGNRYFAGKEAITGEESEISFKINTSTPVSMSFSAVANIKQAEYIYDFCEEKIYVDISAHKDFLHTFDSVDASVMELDLSPMSKQFSDVNVICTDAKGNTSTQTIDTYNSEEDIVELSFHMDTPIENVVLEFANPKKIEVLGIATLDNNYISEFNISTNAGDKYFVGKNAQLAEEYSIKFDIKILIGNVQSVATAQKLHYSYDLAGESYAEGYDFETDKYSFGNTSDNIAEDIYKNAYGDTKGAVLYDLYEGAGAHGLCYGMAGTSAALLSHHDALESFYAFEDKLSDLIPESMCGMFDVSLDTYIRYAHIYQFDSDAQSMEKASENNLAGLYDSVKAYVEGNGRPVVINLYKNEDNGTAKGHSVLAVGIKETDDCYILIINDSDISTERQEFRINKDYSSWSYNGYSSDNADFTFILPADEIYSMGKKINSEKGFFGVGESLITSSQEIEAGTSLQKILAPVGSDEDENGNINAYWVDDEKDAEISSLADDNTVTVYGDKSSLQVVMDEGDEAKVNVDILDNTSVVLKTTDKESRKILFSTLSDDGEVMTLEIEGTAQGGTVSAVNKDNSVKLSGITDGSVTLSAGDEVISSQEITMAESDVEISYGEDTELDVDYVAHEHEYIGTVTKEPTHLEKGEKTYVCACEASYTEEIEKITAHTYTQEITDPTCTAEGCIVYTCECGDTYTESIPAKNHTFKDGEAKCSDCGFDKADDCSCSCHKGGIMGIIWKILNIFYKLFRMNQSCSCGVQHW